MLLRFLVMVDVCSVNTFEEYVSEFLTSEDRFCPYGSAWLEHAELESGLP